jgi:hypothetical protein
MQEVEQRREQLPEEHEGKEPVLFAFLRVLRAFVVKLDFGFSVWASFNS